MDNLLSSNIEYQLFVSLSVCFFVSFFFFRCLLVLVNTFPNDICQVLIRLFNSVLSFEILENKKKQSTHTHAHTHTHTHI